VPIVVASPGPSITTRAAGRGVSAQSSHDNYSRNRTVHRHCNVRACS